MVVVVGGRGLLFLELMLSITGGEGREIQHASQKNQFKLSPNNIL